MDHSHAHLLSKYIQQVFAQCGKVCKYISKSNYLYKQTCIQCRFYILAFAQCTLKIFLYYAKQKYSRTYCMYVYKKMPCEHMWQTGKSSFPIVFSFGDSMFLNYALIILGGYYYPMGTKNIIFPHSACSAVCMKNLKRVICKS